MLIACPWFRNTYCCRPSYRQFRPKPTLPKYHRQRRYPPCTSPRSCHACNTFVTGVLACVLALQVKQEAIFPKYRGAPLQRLLEACDQCSAPGNVKDHAAPHSSACYVCASNRKVNGACMLWAPGLADTSRAWRPSSSPCPGR